MVFSTRDPSPIEFFTLDLEEPSRRGRKGINLDHGILFLVSPEINIR